MTEAALAAQKDAVRLDLYRSMQRIRLVEEEIAKRYSEQEMRCPVHLSIGQEATAVGSCAALRNDDQIISSHRGHGHYMAKGGNLKAMLAEIYGRVDGCCGGRGGSMHLFDDSVGMLASVPIVASFVPLGVGAALAYRHFGQDRVCIVYLGDGATEEGVFHESMNLAAVHKVPVVFFIENNSYSCYIGLADRQPVRPLTDMAKAYAMPSASVDGNDVEAVQAVTAQAVARARSGGGPTLIVADTYRWREHCGPNYDNDLGYRPMAEVDAWRARCPVDTFGAKLVADGVLTEAGKAAINAEIEAEMAEAFAFAKASPFPDPKTVADRVYA
ncbi:MAG: thiamine pyrophosphate-dependent dehydrogenase E1 component subunit alpha [Rhodospirillaceae bacterium]|nr:thiamine pyrophosphate-dependent dehydrogenase E1 component subunit alpha [Rhodospirillales bacterium]